MSSFYDRQAPTGTPDYQQCFWSMAPLSIFCLWLVMNVQMCNFWGPLGLCQCFVCEWSGAPKSRQALGWSLELLFVYVCVYLCLCCICSLYIFIYILCLWLITCAQTSPDPGMWSSPRHWITPTATAVHCIVQCALSNVHSSLCIVHSSMCIVYSPMCSANCALWYTYTP